MGGKGNWFSNVKKALSPDSKEKKEEKSGKSKKKWFGKQKHQNPYTLPVEAATLPPLPPQQEEVEEATMTDVEVEQHSYENPVPVAAAAAPEPPVAAIAPPPAPEVVVQAPRVSRFVGKSGEEAAAIKIQTAFRGYLARRALRALRGLVRLKLLMEGSVVKRQAVNTLKCMQTLARVQSQIRSRRIRMLEENQALQRQLLQKHAKDLEGFRLGEEWDDSLQSKEQIEASLLSKYEASVRRERALAYAFSHQQTLKNPSRSMNPMFMDPRNPTWGWSWLERWMAARPWENRGGPNEKDSNNDNASVRSRSVSGGEINKSYARYLLNSEKLSSPTASQKPSNPTFQSPSTPTAKPVSSTPTKKVKSASPRVNRAPPDDDARSMASVHSDRLRRHSIAGSTIRDDESLASSPSLPSYMVPTESARAKSRLQSPMAGEKNGTTPEKGPPAETAKKRLSFPPSPAAKPRRHSGPPKVDTSSVASVTTENNNESNGITVG